MVDQRLWSRRSTKYVSLGLGLLIIILGSCAFLRISSVDDVEAYWGMMSECHPVWKEFAFRRFGAGDSVSNLFQRFPPDEQEEFGRYGVYSFSRDPGAIQFTGVRVTTRDGRLLSAGTGSCTWDFLFFDVGDLNIDREYHTYLVHRYPDVFGRSSHDVEPAE